VAQRGAATRLGGSRGDPRRGRPKRRPLRRAAGHAKGELVAVACRGRWRPRPARARGRGRRRWWTASSRWPPSTPSSGRPGPPHGLELLTRRPGWRASPSSVRRAMARRGLLPAGRLPGRALPARQGPPGGVRRPDATACGRPTCSGLESLAGGIWRMGGVVEDWARLCLACPVTTSQGTREAVAAIEAAIEGGRGAAGPPAARGTWSTRPPVS
jgi:hypothetical protein